MDELEPDELAYDAALLLLDRGRHSVIFPVTREGDLCLFTANVERTPALLAVAAGDEEAAAIGLMVAIKREVAAAGDVKVCCL